MPQPLPPIPPSENPKAYSAALEYLFGRVDYERRANPKATHQFRLERTADLLHQLGLQKYLATPWIASPGETGAPQSESVEATPPIIHIAGTKGKGSTANLVSEVLSNAGYRVGMYTSPHLSRIEERFRIDGVPCSPGALVHLIESVAPAVDRVDQEDCSVSFFELTTAMAIKYFDLQRCDAIVLEVGLGGRLDSTNVCASTVTAITSIGLDHQRVLGDTIGQIAGEKAGIIKPGIPIVSGARQREAREVIRRKADQNDSMLFEIDEAFEVLDHRVEPIGSSFLYCAKASQLCVGNDSPRLPIRLSVDGAHQAVNASLAISLVRLLSASRTDRRPIEVSDDAVRKGLRNVRLNGRIERFTLPVPDSADPIHVVLDTAHNRDSIAALCDTIARRCEDAPSLQNSAHASEAPSNRSPGSLRKPIIVVFGTSGDKDVREMAMQLGRIADHVVCTQYTTNPRSFPAEKLPELFVVEGEAFQPQSIDCVACPFTALEKALGLAQDGGTVVICGSFFLAGQLRPHLLTIKGIENLNPDGPWSDNHPDPVVTSIDDQAAANRPCDRLSTTTIQVSDQRIEAT